MALLRFSLAFVPTWLIASCAPPASPCAEFRRSDLAAIVRIHSVRHPKPFTTESSGVILRRFKGPLGPGAAIDFYGGGVCYDAPGEAGATYVLYALRLPDGRYSTDCTRTLVMGERRRDLDFLERFSARPWLAMVLEPFGCNEQRLPEWLRRIWLWNLTRLHQTEW